MTAYNVRRSVIEIIEAPNVTEAKRLLAARLEAAGFEPYDGDDFETLIFEEGGEA